MSETAFLTRQGEGSFTIRWFTPTKEIDLCGHATLASAHVIFSEQGGEFLELISPISGRLRVSRFGQMIAMSFPSYQPTEVETSPLWKEAFGITPIKTLDGLFAVGVLESAEDLASIQPNLEAVSRIHAHGVVLTAPSADHDFVHRVFVPNFGVDEDPVTGSACCVLGPYWSGELGKSNLYCKQLSKRTGEVWLKLENDRVLIAGRCWTYFAGALNLDPDAL